MPGKTYRRSRLELYLDVLKAIYNGRRAPSRVVYAANLSYDRVMNCIDFLLEHDLVERIEGIKKKRYTATESGANVIKYFTEIEKHMGRTKQSEKITLPIIFG
jgi:predicted transcriptional regulator